MAYPKAIPIDDLPKQYLQVVEIGKNYKRFVVADGGGVTRDTLVYQVPPGKKAIVLEIYSIVYQFLGNPSGMKWVKEDGTTIYARIAMAVAGGTVYGSVNYINAYPITMIEGEKLYLELNGGDLAQYLAMSALIEEKDKNS